jgi:hypothetical protein
MDNTETPPLADATPSPANLGRPELTGPDGYPIAKLPGLPALKLANGPGTVRKLFGKAKRTEPGGTRGLDNDRIDEDLAREYGSETNGC